MISRLSANSASQLRLQIIIAVCVAAVILVGYLVWNNWSRAPLALMGLVAVVGLLVIFRFPVVGAMLPVYMATSSFAALPRGAMSPLLLATGFLLLLRKLLSRDVSWTITPFIRWGTVFIAWTYICSIWAPSFEYFQWSNAYRALLIMFVFSEAIKTNRALLLVLSAAGIGVITTAVLTVQSAVNFFSSETAAQVSNSAEIMSTTRYSGEWSDPNFMAVTVALFIGLSYVVARSSVPLVHRIIGIVAVLLGTTAVFMSLSRGGLIALLIALAVVISAERWRFVLISSVLLALLFAPLMLPIDVVGRLATLGAPSVDASVMERSALYMGGLELALDSLPFGTGVGNFRTYIADYVPALPAGMISHNGYVQILVESGVVGFSLFIAMLVTLFHASRKFLWRLRPEKFEANLAIGMRASLWVLVWSALVLNTEFFVPCWIVMTLMSLSRVILSNTNSSHQIPYFVPANG